MVKNNCVEDAWDLVNKTYDNEWQRQSVNTVIYSTILRGFAMSKQPAKLMQVYTELPPDAEVTPRLSAGPSAAPT